MVAYCQPLPRIDSVWGNRNHGTGVGSLCSSVGRLGRGPGCFGGTKSYAIAALSSSSSLPNPFRLLPPARALAVSAFASVYDKITAAGKAADCSRSILTASTAMMQDPSYDDSISSSIQRTPPRRRRGRSRTPNEAGTNSRGSQQHSSSHSRGSVTMQQQQQQQYQQQQEDDLLLGKLLHGYEHELNTTTMMTRSSTRFGSLAF
eukprot:jgi/Psemu1/41814/gm1.41814_g